MLSDEVKKLEEQIEELKVEKNILECKLKLIKEQTDHYKACCEMVIPNKVYTHKARRNTTVKFLDGSQKTVTRIKGEKDCIETAIAYAILKQLLPPENLKKLIEEREEH